MQRVSIFIVLIVMLLPSCSNAQIQAPEMVFVKGGNYNWKKFLEIGSEEVTVRDLYVQKHETTRVEWEAYIEATGKKDFYKIQVNHFPYKSVMAYPESAAIGMTFFEALEFCNWRSEQDGYKPVYELGGSMPIPIRFYPEPKMPEIKIKEDANGYRLPFETEWIYFAFGGSDGMKSRWWEKENLNEFAWLIKNSSTTKEVGQLKVNPLGLKDVFGNAWEWCWDIKPNSVGKEGENSSRLMEGLCIGYKIPKGMNILDITAAISSAGVNPLERYYTGIRLVRNVE